MSKGPKTIREPGLNLGLSDDAITGDARLSAMSALTIESGNEGQSGTLQGSVRGPTARSGDGSSGRRLVLNEPRFRQPSKKK